MQEQYIATVLDGGASPHYHFGMGVLTTYRERAGLKQHQLAELVGTSQPQIQRLETGKRGLSRKWAIKIAPHVKAVPEELMFGDRTVPIVGIVGAGSEAQYDSDSDANLGRARAPRGGTEGTVAVEIMGDSLGAAFDGWIIYYDERRDPPTDNLLSKLCVVGMPSGQVFVKVLMRGRLEGHFDLFPGAGGIAMTDQPVSWASRVIAMAPAGLVVVETPPEAEEEAVKRSVKRKPKAKKRRR